MKKGYSVTYQKHLRIQGNLVVALKFSNSDTYKNKVEVLTILHLTNR